MFLAGLRTGVPVWRLIIHDWQKFTISEFPKYARYFFGGKQEKDKEPFMFAWLHHVHYGPHHWEYWLLNPDYNFATSENGKLPMPETYVREMVADWMGASRTYTGSWDMSKWLTENEPRIASLIHDKTHERLCMVLHELDYIWQDGIAWVRR